MANNSKIQTLGDFIRYGNSSTYTVPTTSFLRRFENLIIHDKFAYEKYDYILNALSSIAELSDEELNYVKYRPDLLSYRIYGTPNLSHLLLYLNKCAEYEFDKKRVRYIALDDLKEIFNLILANETNEMDKVNKEAAR